MITIPWWLSPTWTPYTMTVAQLAWRCGSLASILIALVVYREACRARMADGPMFLMMLALFVSGVTGALP